MTATDNLANLGLALPPARADRQLCALASRRQHAVPVRCRTTQCQRVLDTGKVGQALTIDQAYDAAKSVRPQSHRQHEMPLGSIDRVDTILKVFGMVNAAPNFIEHPKVINGCTDLFVAVFGDNGWPARSAVGMGSLPGNISVEIEAIVLVR